MGAIPKLLSLRKMQRSVSSSSLTNWSGRHQSTHDTHAHHQNMTITQTHQKTRKQQARVALDQQPSHWQEPVSSRMRQSRVWLALWVQPILPSCALLPYGKQLRPTGSILAASQNEDKATTTVQIFDNTFNPSACEMIHYLAQEHCERTSDGSSFFTRPPHNERPLTPIEHAIDSALIEMGDNTKGVEYWSRDEYMNIDVHADIDEAMLEAQGSVRCPLVGHVLYLVVADGVHGPTCVFPGEQMGWGLQESKSSEDEKNMLIVPAVAGRILRFPGNAMHAVPNPPNRWLLSLQEETALREDEASCVGDEDEDDDDKIERSVLLFNTWPDGEPRPRGVTGDIATGALPEGIELSEEDAAAFLKSQEELVWNEWEEDYGKNGQDIRCNASSEWEPIVIEEISTEAATGSVTVSLMGRENRRLYPKQSAEMEGPRSGIERALVEDSRVSRALLTSDDEII